MKKRGSPQHGVRPPQRETAEVFRAILIGLSSGTTVTEEKGLLGFLACDFFGLDYETLNKGVLGWELNISPFLSLPEGFENWDEWEEILLSALRAKAKVSVPNRTGPRDLEKVAFVAKTIKGEFAGGYTRQDWIQVFEFLANDDKLRFEDALAFFRNIDSKNQNYKLGRASLTPRRQWSMAHNWIGGDPLNDEFPALCMMDNDSSALVLAHLEAAVLYSKKMTAVWGMKADAAKPMTAPNFSREKAKLGLVSCK